MKIYKLNIAIKTLLLLLVLCMCFPAFAVKIDAQGIDIPCESSSKAYAVYLYCIEENSALFDKNSDKKISPASTVKLMTALTAYDKIENVDSFVTVTEEMIGDVKSNVMKLKVGERIRIKDIFAGLVCAGYNDAANALAVIASGSVEAFVKDMNARAEEIGATNTYYTEPTGIDDDAQTTAYDTMIVAKEFMSRDFLMNLSAAPSVNILGTNMSSERTLYNRNALISNRTSSKYLNSAAEGMSAGMTSGGGYCLVTSTQNDDRTYICVVMGAEYSEKEDAVYSYIIANELLNYIDQNLGYKVLMEAGSEVRKIPVVGANINRKNVSVHTFEDVKVYLPDDGIDSELLKMSFVYFDEELTAPVSKGSVVGNIIVSYDDEILLVSDLVVSEDIERDSFMYFLELMKNMVLSKVVMATVLCFVLLLTTYMFICPRLRTRRRKKQIGKYKYK